MGNENFTQHPKQLLNFLSHYVWLIFFLPIILYFLLVKNYQNVPEIRGMRHQWNSSYNPHILGYISDNHITNYYPHSIEDSEQILKILNETQVEKILVTGDICDNFASKSMFKHGHQYEDDFIYYQSIFSKYPKNFIIIASGNHDEFGVEEYTSSNHYILKYADFYKENEKYKDYDNFLISKIQHKDIEIFVMNPYHYPTVNAGLGYYMNITSDMINKIEAVVSAPSNASARIIITHFPLSYTTVAVRSSSKKTLMEVMQTNNLTVILAGHSHKELIVHRNHTLEIHANAIKRDFNRGQAYRYITIDNGNLNDHGFSLKEQRPMALLTYPIKNKILSDRTDFSFENFNQAEIRVVHFSERKNLNITVSCSCKSTKYQSKFISLDFQRLIRPNQSLYSTPLRNLCDPYRIANQSNSIEYGLTFSNDWNYSTTFTTGNSVKLKKEKLETDVTMSQTIIIIGIACWIIIFFVWCPFPPIRAFNRLSNWIAGDKNYSQNCSNISIECAGVIFGFTLMKSQIYNNIAKWIQIVYFIFILSPFFLPSCLLKVGDYIGFICFLGYYLKSFAFDYWGIMSSCLFVLFVLLPSTIIFAEIGFISQTKKCSFFFVSDFLLEVLHIGLVIYSIGGILYQSTTTAFSILSPLFAIEPLVIFIMQLLAFSKYGNQSMNNKKKDEIELKPENTNKSDTELEKNKLEKLTI